MESPQRTSAVIVLALYFTIVASSPLMSTTTRTHARCDPSLEDQNLPDQSHCSKYFRCVYGKLVPKICPEKMLFNPDIGNCDLFYNVDCLLRAQTGDADEKKAASDIEGVRSTTFKKAKAVENSDSDTSTISRFVYIPHEEYLNAFYKIENGRETLLYCDPGMMFSLELEICVKLWKIK